MRTWSFALTLLGPPALLSACDSSAPAEHGAAAAAPGSSRAAASATTPAASGSSEGTAVEHASTGAPVPSKSVQEQIRERAALPAWPPPDGTPRGGECIDGMHLCTVGSWACCCLACWRDGDNTYSVGCVCGGGGGACFPGETMITMANGSERRIADVKVGDEVLSLDPKTEALVVAKVLAVDEHEASGYPMVSIDGLRISVDHPVIVGDQLVPAAMVVKGDTLRKLDKKGAKAVGSKVKRVASEEVLEVRAPASGPLYTLEVEGSNTYVASSIVVAGKLK